MHSKEAADYAFHMHEYTVLHVCKVHLNESIVHALVFFCRGVGFVSACSQS